MLKYFFLNSGGFSPIADFELMEKEVVRRSGEVDALIAKKKDMDRDAHLIEWVAECLATRNPQYAEDLSPELAARFEPPSNRKGYLRMDEELCDLPLSARRALGNKLQELIQSIKHSDEASDMRYAAVYIDSKPIFLYLLISSRGVPREELFRRAWELLIGGLAHYKKSEGMFIIDRDGRGFEVGLIEGYQPTQDAISFGCGSFGTGDLSHYYERGLRSR